jgi:hypothetical protein
MRRFILTLVSIIAASTTAPVNAAGTGTGGGGGDSGAEIIDSTLLVWAGSESDLVITGSPGSTGGRLILCSWHDIGHAVDTPALGGVENLVEGHYYYIQCHFSDDQTIVAGYPITASYVVGDMPGIAADTAEVARFAVNHLNFESPLPVLSPAGDQIVGVETWLAVTSQLDYPSISADAGPVWATVRPVFRSVTWDMGNGDRVTCTREGGATTVWNRNGSANQSSGCTYVYGANGDGEFAVNATVTWDILQRNDQNPAEHPWGSLTLATTLTVPVRELQAVID